jgi:hypothetical protein
MFLSDWKHESTNIKFDNAFCPSNSAIFQHPGVQEIAQTSPILLTQIAPYFPACSPAGYEGAFGLQSG